MPSNSRVTSRITHLESRGPLQAAELHKKLSQRLMKGGGTGAAGDGKDSSAQAVDVKRAQWLQLQVAPQFVIISIHLYIYTYIYVFIYCVCVSGPSLAVFDAARCRRGCVAVPSESLRAWWRWGCRNCRVRRIVSFCIMKIVNFIFYHYCYYHRYHCDQHHHHHHYHSSSGLMTDVLQLRTDCTQAAAALASKVIVTRCITCICDMMHVHV